MPVFSYTARNNRQARVRGAITADSPRQARQLLRSRALVIEQLAAESAASRFGFSWLTRKRAGKARVAEVLRELATLLSVGVNLLDAIDTLARQHRGHMHTSLLLLRDRIAAGEGLSEAMAEQPLVYDELSIRMVEVGESAGNLDVVLGQLADFQEQSLQLKDRIMAALLYPAMIFCTAAGVSAFLMTVVVPMLLTNLIEAGQPLPWPTRVLKAVSDFLVGSGWLLALAAAVLLASGLAVLRTPRGRYGWHRFLLHIPLLGSLAQRQAISRVAFTIATLLRSGVVYLHAAEIAAKASRNLVFREALMESGRAVAAGRDIGEALQQTGVFPPLAVHIFTVGQAAGQLEEMLERLAVNYDRQVTSLTNRLASILEPIMILALAIFVGFILFATLLPILEAGNVL